MIIEKPSNPRMHNIDGMYAAEARAEDYVSLRDTFANSAMLGILNNGIKIFDEIQVKEAYRVVAFNAYLMADIMLEERTKETIQPPTK